MPRKKIVLLLIALVIIICLAYAVRKGKSDDVQYAQTTEQTNESAITAAPTPAPSLNPASLSPRAKNIIATWKSTTDTKYTRTFQSNGAVVDSYEGNIAATKNGAWSEVVEPASEPFELPDVDDAVFIKVHIDKQSYYYLVSADSTTDKLHLVSLNGKGDARFTRVK